MTTTKTNTKTLTNTQREVLAAMLGLRNHVLRYARDLNRRMRRTHGRDFARSWRGMRGVVSPNIFGAYQGVRCDSGSYIGGQPVKGCNSRTYAALRNAGLVRFTTLVHPQDGHPIGGCWELTPAGRKAAAGL